MSEHSKGEFTDPRLKWCATGLAILAILFAAIGLGPHPWRPASPIWGEVSTRLYEVLEMVEGHFPAEKIASNGYLELSSVLVVLLFSLAVYVLIDKFVLNFRLWWTGFRRGRHVVVCGLGGVGLQIVKDYANGETDGEDLSVVAIEKNDSCPGIAKARRLGAVVVIGDASEHLMLKEARAHKAHRMFAVTSSDVANVEIAAELAKRRLPSHLLPRLLYYLQKLHEHRVECHAHLTDPGLAELFRLAPGFTGANSGANVRGFNSYQRAAHQVIRDLYPDRLPRGGEVAHYFIFGFGAMGQTVARELGMQAHFINLKRFRITVFDPAADSASKLFLKRYPAFCPESRRDLGQAGTDIDRWDHFDPDIRPAAYARAEGGGAGPGIEYVCNAEFFDLPADIGPLLSHILAPRVLKPLIVPSFIVCFEDERQSLSAAINLRHVLREFGRHQVFVWVQRESALEQILTAEDGPESGITGFGNPAKVCNWKHIVQEEYERLAEFMHEQYRAKNPTATGPANKPWAELSEEFRASSFQRACHMDVKLRVLGLKRVPDTPENAGLEAEKEPPAEMIEPLAEMEHNRWNAERLMGGWRYGATRDDRLKIHPCLIPFARLRDDIKAYDRKAGPELFNFLRKREWKVVKIT